MLGSWYSNPMAMLTGYMLRYTGVKTVGLCHSVQTCASELLSGLGISLDGVAITSLELIIWLGFWILLGMVRISIP